MKTKLKLSHNEIKVLLCWREGSLIGTLEKHSASEKLKNCDKISNNEITFRFGEIRALLNWAEKNLSGHFGMDNTGIALSREEMSVLKKLQNASDDLEEQLQKRIASFKSQEE